MFTILIYILLALSSLAFIFRCKKLGGNLFLGTLLIFWLTGSSLVPYLFAQNLQQNYSTSSKIAWKDSNTIILLGSGTFKNVQDNQNSSHPTNYSRIYETARLYDDCQKAGKICEIIISAGNFTQSGLSEAESYKQSLLTFNIQSSDITTETKSNNTWEHAEKVAEILKIKTTNQTILVTSGIHMKRALLYFTALNIHPIPAASDYLKPIVSIAPVGYNLALSDQTLHEYLSIAQYYLQTEPALIAKRNVPSYAYNVK